MNFTVDDGEFAVALGPRHGINGCQGNDGDCIFMPEYVVRLGYCEECEDTKRDCRWLGHPMDMNVVRLCRECGVKVREWDVLVSIEGLRIPTQKETPRPF